jgi:hypothetical protein
MVEDDITFCAAVDIGVIDGLHSVWMRNRATLYAGSDGSWSIVQRLPSSSWQKAKVSSELDSSLCWNAKCGNPYAAPSDSNMLVARSM